MAEQEQKWTPGPWEWDAGDEGTDYSLRYCRVFVDGGDLIIADVNDLFDRDVGHANAHLIAAAPELYEALRAVVLWIDAYGPNFIYEDDEWDETARQIDAALARARGQSPDEAPKEQAK